MALLPLLDGEQNAVLGPSDWTMTHHDEGDPFRPARRRTTVRGVGRLPPGLACRSPTVCPTTSWTLLHFCPTARAGAVTDAMALWVGGAGKGVYPT